MRKIEKQETIWINNRDGQASPFAIECGKDSVAQ